MLAEEYREDGIEIGMERGIERGEILKVVSVIRRMLANTVYIGELAQGKTATPSFKIKKARTLSRDMWSIVENNHEAIIEPEVFQTVQKILSRDMVLNKRQT